MSGLESDTEMQQAARPRRDVLTQAPRSSCLGFNSLRYCRLLFVDQLMNPPALPH